MYSSENHLHGNQVDNQTCTACSAVVKPGNTFSDAVIHKMRKQDKCKCDLTSPSTCLQLLATYRLQEHAVRHTCVNLVPRAKCTRNRPKSLNTYCWSVEGAGLLHIALPAAVQSSMQLGLGLANHGTLSYRESLRCTQPLVYVKDQVCPCTRDEPFVHCGRLVWVVVSWSAS